MYHNFLVFIAILLLIVYIQTPDDQHKQMYQYAYIGLLGILLVGIVYHMLPCSCGCHKHQESHCKSCKHHHDIVFVMEQPVEHRNEHYRESYREDKEEEYCGACSGN